MFKTRMRHINGPKSFVYVCLRLLNFLSVDYTELNAKEIIIKWVPERIISVKMSLEKKIPENIIPESMFPKVAPEKKRSCVETKGPTQYSFPTHRSSSHDH